MIVRTTASDGCENFFFSVDRIESGRYNLTNRLVSDACRDPARSDAMVRIKVLDLPILEELAPEEMQGIIGGLGTEQMGGDPNQV
jgi:hypothetical protein